jgi:hypothetical protein
MDCSPSKKLNGVKRWISIRLIKVVPLHFLNLVDWGVFEIHLSGFKIREISVKV